MDHLTPETNDTNQTAIETMIETMIVAQIDRPIQDESHIKKYAPAPDHTRMIAPNPTQEAKKGPQENSITGSPTRIARATYITTCGDKRK
jgi:hypothetical protein